MESIGCNNSTCWKHANGEAANMITQVFRDAHTEIPWKMVLGMRNYIVHEYFRIDNDIVWEDVSNELPLLKQQISFYNEQTDWTSWEQNLQ